jgi:hypothetical protein
MIRKLLILPVVALLFATMSLSTLTSCEKDPADLNDTITFEELNAPYTVITPTVAPTKTTSLTFYARSTVMSNSGGSVDVFLDGNYVNSIFVTTSSGVIPNCGLSGNVTTTVTTGSHTWFARSANGFYDFGTTWSPRSITVTTVTCNKQEVAF